MVAESRSLSAEEPLANRPVLRRVRAVDTPFRGTEQAMREAACVVAVSGDVDLATIAAMADCLIAAVGRMQIRTVILDLEQVTFMGAIGVESMMNAQDLADRRGTVLRLR